MLQQDIAIGSFIQGYAVSHLSSTTTTMASVPAWSLRPLVQLPNFHVPGVCVSSPENNFLVSRDCNLATAQEFCDIIGLLLYGLLSSVQDGGSSISLHYLYRLLLHVGTTTIL